MIIIKNFIKGSQKMKGFKKIISISIVFALIISLSAAVNVFAVQVNIPIDFSDIVTYSFDITVPEGTILGIEFTAPCNTAATTNLGWSYGAGSVKMANGKIQASKNWLSSDNANIAEPCADFPSGQTNNIIIRKNHRTGYTEFVANGVPFCRTTVDNKTLPITMLNVHGSGAAASTINTVFVKGTESGEMGTVTKYDKKTNEITIRFTEPLIADTELGATILKSANMKKADGIPLTQKSFDGISAVFACDAPLDEASEYAVILPDGLAGSLGGTIREYPRFTTELSNVYQECDYNNGSATIWKNDGLNIADTGDEKYGNALPFRTQNTDGTYDKSIMGLDIPDSNIFSISFDVKVLVDTVKMGWTLWQQGGKSVTIGYGSSDGTASGNFTMLQIDSTNLNGGWLGSGTWQNKIGTYQTGRWINYKTEFNRTDKTVKVYVDNVLKTTKSIGADVIAAGEISTGGTWVFQVLSGIPTTEGETFMYMDNIKVETVSEPAAVSEVKFVDARGREQGAFDTISRLLNKVKVKFGTKMNADTLNGSTVKLMYGEQEVGCTRTYDSTSNTYTLIPHSIPDVNTDVKLIASGAKTAVNDDVGEYETRAVTDGNMSSGVVVYELDAVDETDVKPLDGNLTTNKYKYNKYYPIMRTANYSDKDKNVTLIAAEYDESGMLINVNVSDTITIKPGEYKRYGGKLNGDNMIQALSGTKTIKVFAWGSSETLMPMSEAVTAIKNY